MIGVKKSFAIVVSMALCATGLSACSSVLNPGGSKAITVYSNSLTDSRETWLRTRAEKAGFKLNFVSLGGGQIYNRLEAEKTNPVASVVFGLNDIYYQRLWKDHVIEPYTPKWADKVDQSTVDPSKAYWPIVREPIMLVCNKAAYPSVADMPHDWPDLWTNPKFKDKYEVPAKLGGATTQVVLSSILVRYRDPNGKLGVSQAGWDAVKKFFADGSRSIEGTDLYARMKEGQVNCGEMWLSGKEAREKQYGIKTVAIRPEGGVPMVRQYTALIRGGKNQEEAKRFIDWFGSAKIQGEWSRTYFTAPENKDAEKIGSQWAIKFTDSFKQQKIDWRFVASHLDKWMEEIQLKYAK